LQENLNGNTIRLEKRSLQKATRTYMQQHLVEAGQGKSQYSVLDPGAHIQLDTHQAFQAGTLVKSTHTAPNQPTE